MHSLKIATFLALLCAVAIAQDEALDDNFNPDESNDAVNAERKFYRPLLLHPHFHHPLHKPHPTETGETSSETPSDENTETPEKVEEDINSVEEDQVKGESDSAEDDQVQDDQVEDDQVQEESLIKED